MFRGLSYPMKALKGHSSVFNGLEWVLAFVLTRTGDLTAGRIPMAGAGNVLGDSHFEDATTGNFKLSKTGAWTANRTRAMVDADGTEMTLEAAQTVSGVKTFSNGVVMALGSAGAPSIGATGGTTTGLFFTTTSVGISISGAEAFRVDSSARLLGGGGSSRTVGTVAGAKVQVEGTAAAGSAMTLVRDSNDANPPRFAAGKTRDASLGGSTAVTSGDQLFSIQVAGGDGTNLASVSSEIRFEVDGAVSPGIVPGRLRFLTANASGVLTEALRIDNANQVGIGGYTPVSGNGLLQFASGTTKANGISWGTDVFLYRDAANSLLTEGGFRSNGATNGIGYSTGAGGTVTQITSKATAVTLSKVAGTITLNAAALASATSVAFTWTNTAIAATDVVVCVHDSVGTLGGYGITVTPGAGSAAVTVRNNTAGSLSEAIVLRFVVIKAVTS